MFRSSPSTRGARAARRPPGLRPRRGRRAALAAALAVAGLVAPAAAEELVIGIEQAVTGQSNLFRSTTTPLADGNYEIAPYVRVQEDTEAVRYYVEYRPSYQVYFVSEDVNGLDHFFRANLVWDVARVSRFRFRADVADYRSVRGLTADGPDGIPDVIPQATGDITRTFVNLDYEHEITRATVAIGTLGLQSYEYTTPNNADSLGVGGDVTLVHRPRQEIGLGGSLLASHRRYEALSPQPASRNTVLNANFVALYEPSPDLFIELSAGPAVVMTRQDQFGPAEVARYSGFDVDTIFGPLPVVRELDLTTPNRQCSTQNGQPVLLTCPLVFAPAFPGSFTEQIAVGYDPGTAPPPVEENIVTAFASAEIRREDAWGYWSLGYFRREDASAGIGTTTIRDSVTLSIGVTKLLGFEWRLRGNWNQRSATGAEDRLVVRAGASPFTGPGAFPIAQANGLLPSPAILTDTEITQYWADVLATREIRTRTWLELGFRYVTQRRVEQPNDVRTEFDNIVGSLMLRYEFSPFPLF